MGIYLYKVNKKGKIKEIRLKLEKIIPI
jgi:hypothetical protein